MNIIEPIKSLLRPPSARELAARELDEAERSRLGALSAAEYATAMAAYHLERIARLKAYLQLGE